MSDREKIDPPSYFEATGIQGFSSTNYDTNWNTDFGPGPGVSDYQQGQQEMGNHGSLVVKSEPTSYSDSSTSSKTSIDNQSDSISLSSSSNWSRSIISDPSASSSSSSDSSSISTSSLYLCSCICPCCSCKCC